MAEETVFGSAYWGIYTILVLIFVFLLGREIVCWYWKMNETVSLLTEIRDLLKSSVVEEPTSKFDKWNDVEKNIEEKTQFMKEKTD